MSVFGLAEIKEEGKTMRPMIYFLLNGELPPKSIYSTDELEEQEKQGYDEEWYK